MEVLQTGAEPARGRALKTFVRKLIRSESGATAIEYGLIVALVFVAIIGAITTVGVNLGATFNTASNALD